MRSLGARHAFSRTFVTRNDSEVRVPAVAAVDESCGKADMGRAIFRPNPGISPPLEHVVTDPKHIPHPVQQILQSALLRYSIDGQRAQHMGRAMDIDKHPGTT